MTRSKKAAERAELAKLRTITITLEASEATLQRIAALLLFADHEPKYTVTDDAPLPWEEVKQGPMKQLEIDRNAVQNALVKDLEWYLDRYGEEKTREMVRSFGAEKVSGLDDGQLLDLQLALAAEIKAAHE